MFNFQKEVVLNSLEDVKVINAGGGGRGKAPSIDKKVRFLDGGEYFAKYIVDSKIYYTNPIPGANFKLVLKTPAGILSKHIQILIELGLDNDYRGDYGSALWYFRKPILVDVFLPNDNAGASKKIYDAIKAAIPQEYKFITVTHESDANTVTVYGADSYQKVRKLVISEFSCENRCDNSSEELTELVHVSGGALAKGNDYVAYTPNNVEFGTYDYILHNLRLPTYANMRFTSPAVPEMPVKGVKYTQFSFAYCVPRIGFGGLSVAGQTNYSTTLHTFYVAEALVNDFKQKFKDLGFTDDNFVEIGRTGQHSIAILPDSYASSQDLKLAADVKANKASIDANTKADGELKKEVQQNTQKNKEQDTTIANKANTADVYTKTQVYQKSETYSQKEANDKFQPKGGA